MVTGVPVNETVLKCDRTPSYHVSHILSQSLSDRKCVTVKQQGSGIGLGTRVALLLFLHKNIALAHKCLLARILTQTHACTTHARTHTHTRTHSHTLSHTRTHTHTPHSRTVPASLLKRRMQAK